MPAATPERAVPLSPEGRAQELATHARESRGGRGVVEEMQRDLKGMSGDERKRFFSTLATEKGAAGGLPGLEITGSPKTHDVRVGAIGQRPVYQENPGDVRRGEGPYSALHRQHPEWSSQQVSEASKRVNKETGRKAYREGERIGLNEDGSVTLRTEGKDGKFSEERYKDGKKQSTRTGDGAGNWKEEHVGKDGKKTTVDHTQGGGGDYTEKTTDDKGNVTSTKTRKTEQDGSYKERDVNGPNGSYNEVSYDKDGKRTGSVKRDISPNGTYHETASDANGKPLSTTDHMVRPDGSSHDKKTVDGKVVERSKAAAPRPANQNAVPAEDPNPYAYTTVGS